MIHLPDARANSLWGVVWKLLQLRLLITLNGFRRSKTLAKIGLVIAVLALLTFFGLVFFLVWRFMHFLKSPELVELSGDFSFLWESMPIIILSAAFIGILFTSFGVLLQALYLTGDMDFLLSIPIPIRAVFMAKLLQAILPNFGLICLFAVPVLFGIGASANYTVLYYPFVIFLLAALALAAAGIASLLVMLIVRIFPARRVAEILGFIGGIASLICSQTGQIANMNDVSSAQMDQTLQILARVNNPWSPLTWMGNGLMRIGEADWLSGVGITAISLIACMVVFFGALTSAEWLYYNGWANMQVVARKKTSHRRRKPHLFSQQKLDFIHQQVPASVLGIIHKDLLVLRRDMRNMSQLITPIIVGVVYFVMLLRSGNNQPDFTQNAPSWTLEIFRSIRMYSNVALSLFVGWMLLSRLAGMGFAQEGKQYWLLKTAPVKTSELIISKYMVAFLPVTLLCWLFLLSTWVIQKTEMNGFLYAMAVVALTVAGNAGINLAFGVLGANMEWEDPRQMLKRTAGCLGAIATMVYLPVTLLIFLGPGILTAIFHLPVAIGQWGGLILGSAFSLGCAIIPLWMVRERVDRLGEP